MTIPASQSEGFDIADEFAGADLGDARRTKRLLAIAGSLSAEPAESFPYAARDDVALEGTYRFLRNEAVTPEAILSTHFERTVARIAQYEQVIVAHDTTEFEFRGDAVREGLGRLRRTGQGFFGHFALAVAPGEARRPLGILGLSTTCRTGPSKGKRSHRSRLEGENESKRWSEMVDEVEARLAQKTAIHVMDREGDSYQLFAKLLSEERHFVIRAAHDRAVTTAIEGTKQHRKISDELAKAPDVFERMVPLSRRSGSRPLRAEKIHPKRTARLAKLKFRAASVELQRPTHLSGDIPHSLVVNIVQVHEVDTHGDADPVEWILVTSECIETVRDIECIVDAYRTRWVIEEYFKALKTGCAYEKRQLESRRTLLNALAIFIPIAWRLLLLRSLARTDQDCPATEALTPSQVQVLVATSKKELPASPSIRQALLAIAALGGHIPHNGDPGWQVLGRGYDRLLTLELGWLAASQGRRDLS